MQQRTRNRQRQNEVMPRTISRFEKAIREDSEYADLKEALNRHEGARIFVYLAAACKEKFDETMNLYLADTTKSFPAMYAFLREIEGEDGSKKNVNSTDLRILDRFMQWYRIKYFWPAVTKRILEVAERDGHDAKDLLAGVDELRHLIHETNETEVPEYPELLSKAEQDFIKLGSGERKDGKTASTVN